MDLKALLNDDDAVSPVIGVILMVAITVILAAVIASFVLGLGDQTQTTPTASFNFDYDSSSSPPGVQVTHGGGATIDGDELYLRGDTGASSSSSFDVQWSSVSGAGTEVTAGNSVTVDSNMGGVDSDIEGDYEINVVYVSSEGDTSSTLSSDTGPEA